MTGSLRETEKRSERQRENNESQANMQIYLHCQKLELIIKICFDLCFKAITEGANIHIKIVCSLSAFYLGFNSFSLLA